MSRITFNDAPSFFKSQDGCTFYYVSENGLVMFIRYFEKINTHSFGIIPIELLPDTIERISWMDFHDAITYQVVCGNIFYGEILKDLKFHHQEQIDKTDAD